MSDTPEVTAVMFQPSEALRDASPQVLLTEVYRLQAKVDRLELELKGVKEKQNEHLALGATVDTHGIQINEQGGEIEALKRNVTHIRESAESVEKSVDGIRTQNALTYKAQQRRDDTQRELGLRLQEKLDRLLQLHQPTAAL